MSQPAIWPGPGPEAGINDFLGSPIHAPLPGDSPYLPYQYPAGDPGFGDLSVKAVVIIVVVTCTILLSPVLCLPSSRKRIRKCIKHAGSCWRRRRAPSPLELMMEMGTAGNSQQASAK